MISVEREARGATYLTSYVTPIYPYAARARDAARRDAGRTTRTHGS